MYYSIKRTTRGRHRVLWKHRRITVMQSDMSGRKSVKEKVMCDLALRTVANDKKISRKYFRQRKQYTKATEGKNSLTFLNNCKEIRIA